MAVVLKELGICVDVRRSVDGRCPGQVADGAYAKRGVIYYNGVSLVKALMSLALLLNMAERQAVWAQVPSKTQDPMVDAMLDDGLEIKYYDRSPLDVEAVELSSRK